MIWVAMYVWEGVWGSCCGVMCTCIGGYGANHEY